MTHTTISNNSFSQAAQFPVHQQVPTEDEPIFYIGHEEEEDCCDDSSFVTASSSADPSDFVLTTSACSSETSATKNDCNVSLPVDIVVASSNSDGEYEVGSINMDTNNSGGELPPRSASPTSTMTTSLDLNEELSDDLSDLSLSSSHSASTNSLSSLPSPKCFNVLHRSVSWREDIVTDVIYRPKTKSCEKKEFYYNSSDMQRFRQHYKMQVRAAQEYQKRLKKCSGKSCNQGEGKKADQRTRKQQQSLKKNLATVGRNKTSCVSLSTSIQPEVVKADLKGSHSPHQQLYTSPITGLVNTVTSYLASGSKSLSSIVATSSNPSPSDNLNTTTTNSNSSRVGAIAETCVLVDTLYLF